MCNLYCISFLLTENINFKYKTETIFRVVFGFSSKKKKIQKLQKMETSQSSVFYKDPSHSSLISGAGWGMWRAIAGSGTYVNAQPFLPSQQRRNSTPPPSCQMNCMPSTLMGNRNLEPFCTCLLLSTVGTQILTAPWRSARAMGEHPVPYYRLVASHRASHSCNGAAMFSRPDLAMILAVF